MDGIAEYVRRIEPYAKVQMIEVPVDKAPENMSPTEEQQLMRLVLVEQVNRGEPYHK
ncbi:hypothetical protein [Paenibacillus germinis]|uniref:hypothetical protein n=1 Tax=Paenibacillus germinis TaxID=2654979 RepID=UPI001FE9445E|nr:hypothetical protein [Paenibacillus germinis]